LRIGKSVNYWEVKFLKKDKILNILKQLADGETTVEEAAEKLISLPYEDIGYARLDHHREMRTGFPEVIFCQGKTPEQVAEIFCRLSQKTRPVLGTRASEEAYRTVKERCPDAVYKKVAKCIVLPEIKTEKSISETTNGAAAPKISHDPSGMVLVISAGTADMPVAEEAAVCAETMGLNVKRLYDVGVAGIHRLFDSMEAIKEAKVIIVVAGMEGALASVVGGLTRRPVIAVPTSFGYGASFGGLAALLSMLNSCASGVGVVNIDNGFGAAALARAIIAG